MTFTSFSLDPAFLPLLEREGITTPTKIQALLIPAILQGHDVIAESETGSGKTLAFALPLLQKLESHKGVQVIVLAPTRELAKQVAEEFEKFGKWKQIRVLAVYGGVSLEKQVHALPTTDIIVGTPGRVLDLIWRGHLNLHSIKYLVLDEADRMLDMGFIHDIDKILQHTPRQKQTMLFSATITDSVRKISIGYLRNPQSFKVEPPVKKSTLTQYLYQVPFNKKFSLLAHVLQERARQRILVFCKTIRSTDVIADALRKENVLAAAINGHMSQSKRERTMEQFRSGKIHVLIATDVAARGLHVEDISHVINYDPPNDMDTYNHRVGRTARMGEHGDAITFITEHDRDLYHGIHTMYPKVQDVEPKNFPLLKSPFHSRMNRDRFNPRWNKGGRSQGRGRERGRGGRDGRGSPPQREGKNYNVMFG